MWWISAGIAGLGLLVLVVALSMLAGRLGRLRRVERSLRVRADQARQLQEPVLALQRRAEAMQELMAGIQEQMAERAIREEAS
jgi:hypothetical protein